MTRYLSEVSSYYGCQWRQDTMLQQHQQQQQHLQGGLKSYRHMSDDILQQRETDYRRLRLSSLFEKMPKHELEHTEGYSPSVIRKIRAKTVPPLQNIYEDTIFYPSNWASPSLTKKQRRDIIQKQAAKKQAALDKNNNTKLNDRNTTSALRVTEKFETKFHSPQLKRKNFGKHNLMPLPEEKITRSFDESIAEENEEDSSDESSHDERRYRARSWSE